MKELRLGLEGTRLIFPDDRAVCLGCGAEPVGTRRVWFEEVRGGSIGSGGIERIHNLGVGLRAISERISFDAPLCREHRAKARWLTAGSIFFALVAIGTIVAGALLLGERGTRKGATFFAKWGPILVALIPGLPAYVLWRKKDRAGLACEARMEDETLVLSYPEPPAPAR